MAIDSSKARKKIESVSDLPTLPNVASQIIAMARSPKTNAADVGAMIEKDQALTTKVLKLVNSSFYGFPGQIKSIQHAVVIIGFNKVKNVVMTASVFDLAKGRTTNQLDLPKFWEHNLGVAIGAKVVTEELGATLQPEDAFVGGLVHDIGKLMMDLFLTEEYMPCLEAVSERNCLLLEAEKDILGFDHATVGNWLAERWKLPQQLQMAIRQHHRFGVAREEREMIAAVHLGDILARAIGIGNGGDNRIPVIDSNAWQSYNLSYYFLDTCLGKVVDELGRAEEFFNMIET